MLWSLLKIIIFVVLVAAATFAAGHLLEMQGGMLITFEGYEFSLSPLRVVIALLILLVAVWIVLKLASLVVAVLRFLNGDETAISRYFDRNRERKGYQALTEGMMALASGEGRIAMARANKAEKYLRKPALTSLITAQAAEMTGDRKTAEKVYKRLLTNPATRFVGVNGILKQKLADGDTETALKLAQTAFALKPKHEEIQNTLLRLQAGAGDWSGARDTLRTKLKTGTMPRDLHKRRDAVLALSEARDVFDDGNDITAREAAIEANRLSPDLIPAAVMAAHGYIAKGQPKYATRVLKKAWQARPHPDLAAAFAAIAPDETPAQRIKRFAVLTKSTPEERESRLLMAELYLAAEDFPAARRALGDLIEESPDARVLTIMAAVERGEGASEAVVRGWLARALNAPRGPQWVCDNCHMVHTEWMPVCDNCKAFDTLSWQSPPTSDLASSPGTSMLPLLVGGLKEDHPAPAIADADILDPEEEEEGSDADADSSEPEQPAHP